MKLSLFYIALIFLTPFKLFSQNLGARNIALGNTILTHNDILSASQNISKLSSIKSFKIGIASSNQFTLKELQYSLVAIGIPFFKNTLAIDFSSYGFNLYRELKIGIGYSLKLSPKFSMGIKINYQNLLLGENQNSSASFYPDIGSNYRFSEQLELAILFTNLTLSKIQSESKQVWPVVSIIGLSYHTNKKVQMYLEGSLELDNGFSFGYGIEYKVHSMLLLRAGINSQPASFSFGFALLLKNITIDFASTYQSTLGFSPAIAIQYDKIP